MLAGIGFMLLGTALIPIMNTFAKSLAGEFVFWQVTWARFVGHLLLMTLVLCPVHGLSVYVSGRPWLQLARSTVFFGSNAFFIAALPLYVHLRRGVPGHLDALRGDGGGRVDTSPAFAVQVDLCPGM